MQHLHFDSLPQTLKSHCASVQTFERYHSSTLPPQPCPSLRQHVLIRYQRSLTRHWCMTRSVLFVTQASISHTLAQFEFLRQLSADPANTVIGLVRDVKTVAAKVKEEIDRSNVHILHGDLDSYQLMKAGH